ncbi:MAG TPA: sulfite exporter TauE/SafE family protein [Streptosporangiaceae bacterium]|nr:sulfite exporter TauE/SafE family protein [Streptosporangiaceae bacterium]
MAGLIVGVLVGLTGSGGGALMTPILILLFGVTPSAAVSSDIVASAIMKPFGGAIHFRRGTVHGGLVLWLSVGSVPAAFAGVFIDHALGSGPVMQTRIEYAMGAALIVASAALVYRMLLDSIRARRDPASADDEDVAVAVRPALTVAIGVFGGLLVGITSVGSGSLMIVLLMMAYPRLSMRRLVGTDIVQSMPLVGSAAIAHALFGNLEFGLSAAIAIGSIPGVIIGSVISARASNFLLRPVLAAVLGATALKLLGLSTGLLAITVGAIIVVGLPLWAVLDGRGWPAVSWRAAGYHRRRWLTLIALGIPVGLGLVLAMVYFARIRSRLAAAGASEVPPRAPVAAAGLARTPGP